MGRTDDRDNSTRKGYERPARKGSAAGRGPDPGTTRRPASGDGTARDQSDRKKERGNGHAQHAADRAKRARRVNLQRAGLLAGALALILFVSVLVRATTIAEDVRRWLFPEAEEFRITEEITEEMRQALLAQQEAEEEAKAQAQEALQEAQLAAQETEEEETQELTGIAWTGLFELPLEGATGYASVVMSVVDENGSTVASLAAGEAFVILGLDESYFLIETKEGVTGRVRTSYTWVNLPDLIPSIVYYDVNSDSAIFRSSGYDLPGITGEQLYDTLCANERLGQEQYCMPVQYTMALKIMEIQQACLANGESLKIYQAFRPYETQMAVAAALRELESSNAEVYAGINHGAFGDSWFVAQKLSNHQRGCAIDVSLVRVDGTKERLCGDYLYTVVTSYTEYEMPTDMQELSYLAAVYDPPVSSSNDTDWRSATYAATMTEAAYRLQSYCTDGGLSPLSSEWWHFNDLEARSESSGNASNGQFYLEESVSRVPGSA